MDHQISDHIINFLSRKESPEDVQKLKEWLDADPAHREELRQWLRLWDATDMIGNTGKYHPEDAYQRFMFRLKREESVKAGLKKKDKNPAINTIRRLAAVFIISFSLGILFHIYLSGISHKKIAFVETIVPLGSKSELKLPDGSVVWLNAGSVLRYPTDYGKTTRDIYLEGEGYFKVAKQKNKLFTVHTSTMKVKALGTEFNVKAYPDEVAEAMLIEGEILIDRGEEGQIVHEPVLLKPCQKFSIAVPKEIVRDDVVIDAETGDLETENTLSPVIRQLPSSIAAAEVSWKERNWRIESEELQNLAVKIERRYDVKINIDEMLKNYRFTGTLKDESLEQVLTAMQLTSPILFEINGKKVDIYVDKNKMK